MTYAVLIVEDESTLASNMARFLGRHGYDTRIADTAETALFELRTFKPHAIVLDYNLPGMNGLEFLARVRATDPQVKLIMATGHGSEQVAVDAMKAGAYDYLPKPVPLGRLKLVVDRSVREDGVRDASGRRFQPLPKPERALDRLIGESEPMQALKARMGRLLAAEAGLVDAELPAVLITGETGTGKEVIARALHFDGPRGKAPFVEVNCSSIPGHLLEAELFGFERGAFTDAKERKLGLIESAEGGTLFLDEIGEMDLALQAKLLKFLEDKTVRRLGSVREQRADVRIIAATNRNLDALSREGRFRADLYFRLRIVQLEPPSLRLLGDDVARLAQHFLALHAGRYGRNGLTLSPSAMQVLRNHTWPGNVRELRNVMEQAVVLAHTGTIEVEDLPFPREAARDPEAFPSAFPESGTLGDMERHLLVKALEDSGWNVTQAARVLGISRDTLRYRIEKYRLRLPS
jgi:DNA-binding NtrC family response regulator